MVNKIYSKIKEFIKENLVFFVLPIVVFVVLSIPLPYYVDAPGGIISLNNKVNVVNGKNINGNINITYVSVYDGNIGTYLLSRFNKEWDLVPSKEVQVGTEDRSDVKVRNKLLLDNSLSNAYYAVYNYLGKDLDLLSSDIRVLYINENADTNIQVGDKILKIDNNDIKDIDDILNYLALKNIGDKLKVIVNNGEERYVTVGTLDGKKSFLISVICNYDYENDVIFKFNNSESGPSGGVMIALSILDQYTEADLIKGRNIAGTGTIDINGNVGEIGGIKHKIIGASKSNVDIFFLPYENYEEARTLVDTNNYDINLVPVKTFSEVVEYLSK